MVAGRRTSGIPAPCRARRVVAGSRPLFDRRTMWPLLAMLPARWASVSSLIPPPPGFGLQDSARPPCGA
eukprot:4682664-Heterocapsa_arctica.AAC.1